MKGLPLFKFLACVALSVLMSQTVRPQSTATGARPADPAEVEAVTQWLKRNAIQLNGVQAAAGMDDLRPLKKVFKDVRVVGLGEATHGTREFFQFKHRMLEFLVKEMGFTVFAIEASYAACNNINDFVLHGRGNRAEALASQKFWTWDTNEVSDMIDWMREYNRTAPEGKKVKFLGYDVQHFGQGIDLVTSFVKKVAPEYAEKAEAALKPLRLDAQQYSQRSAEEKALSQAQLLELIGYLSFNETRFARATSPAEFEYVLQHARNILQFHESYVNAAKDPKYPFNRDYYMAENIEYLLRSEPPGARMVVWAHNAHISLGNLGSTPAMGAHLRRAFGDAYYALGFSFNEGSFQSRDMGPSGRGVLTEFTVGPAPQGSADWYLARPGVANYVIDFRSAPREGPVAGWLATPHLMRSIGSGFSREAPDERFMSPVTLKGDYDGVVFIGKTTRARPNPTGMRGPINN